MLILWHKVANQQVKRIIMLKCLLFISLLLAQPINSCDSFEDGQKFHRKKAGSPVYLEVGNVTIDGDFDVSAERKKLAIKEPLKISPHFASVVNSPEFKESFSANTRKGFKIKTAEGNAEVGYAVFAHSPDRAMLAVNWLAINSEFRRKGYGEHAILTIEGIAKAHKVRWPDANSICFNVARENAAMTSLLSKLGYEGSLSGGAIIFSKLIPA